MPFINFHAMEACLLDHQNARIAEQFTKTIVSGMATPCWG